MKRRLFLATGLAAGLTLLVFTSLINQPTQAQAVCDRYVVDPDGDDTGDCQTETAPCRTVQYALSQATTDGVICVAENISVGGPSVYTGTIVITRSVTLDGAWTAHRELSGLGYTMKFNHVDCSPTGKVLLDAQGAGSVISITGNVAPTIHCFTITGGKGGGAGGGIYSGHAAPVIVNNVITGNRACETCALYASGGGIYLHDTWATAVISGNLIANNVAHDTGYGQGGGIYLWDSQAEIRHNTIRDNRAGHTNSHGGGISAAGGNLLIADNDILTNVGGLSGLAMGGGIHLWFPVLPSQALTVEHNLIQNNIALSGAASPGKVSRGGGLYYYGVTQAVPIVIRDNTFYRNVAAIDGEAEGGGMYLRYLGSGAAVSGNTVRSNYASKTITACGGGIYLDECQATVEDNAIFDNRGTPAGSRGYGGGMYINGGGGLIRGNVITDNLALENGTGYGGGVMISGSVTLLQDNWIAGNWGTWVGQGAGGGVFVWEGAPQFARNHVLGNEAGGCGAITGSGGGFSLWATRPWLEGNTILDNIAAGGDQGRGGGVRLLACPAFTLTNNIVARNDASAFGSGVAILDSAGSLIHNTVAENLAGDGVGVGVVNSTVGLVNNIVATQTLGISRTGGTVMAWYTLFDGNGLDHSGGVASTNEVSGPAALYPNYHLRSDSGAIDAAFSLAWVTADVDGDPRPIGSAPDVGADEARFIYLPLVLKNSP